MKKEIIVFFKGFISMFALMYLIVGFVEAEINFFEWGRGARAVACFVPLIINIVMAGARADK